MQHHLIQRDTAHRHGDLPAFGVDLVRQDVGSLVEQARTALDTDPGRARRCLDQVALLLLTGGISQSVHAPVRNDAPVKGGLACWQLRLIDKHIAERLEKPIPITALSQIARLSDGHFCRAFKMSTGETPHTYIVRKRLERAQRMMIATGDSLSQIACACGLTDQAHLTRLFRKFVGQTPLAWRRSRQHA